MNQWQLADWLTAERLRIYPRLFIFIYIISIIIWVMLATHNIDLNDRFLGADFISFYAAGRLALEGDGELAYNLVAHHQMEVDIINVTSFEMYFLPFSYPPIFLLLLAPLSKIPYFYACLIFQSFSLIFFVLMIKKLSNRNESIMLCLAFPAVLLNLYYGQNAFLSTGLLAGAFFYIDRKPILAGILIALLTFKPHLGVLIPFILIFSGRWQVFITATLTFLSLVFISYLAFGIETWQAFWDGREFLKRVLQEELVGYALMQSMFTAARSMGAEVFIAYVTQSLLAVTTAISVVWVWSRQVDIRLKVAALATGTLMISPYLLNYDLTIISIAIACLASYSFEFGFRPGMVNLLCISWLAPAIVTQLNSAIPFPWTPLLLSVLLYQIIIITRGLSFSINTQSTIDSLK